MFPLLRLPLLFCFDLEALEISDQFCSCFPIIVHEMDTGTDSDVNSIVGFVISCLDRLSGSNFAEYES